MCLIIERIVETLNCLNAMGIQISIDDFWTGYSNLSYLKRFQIHTLKENFARLESFLGAFNDIIMF